MVSQGLVRPARIELATLGLGVPCSIQIELRARTFLVLFYRGFCRIARYGCSPRARDGGHSAAMGRQNAPAKRSFLAGGPERLRRRHLVHGAKRPRAQGHLGGSNSDEGRCFTKAIAGDKVTIIAPPNSIARKSPPGGGLEPILNLVNYYST